MLQRQSERFPNSLISAIFRALSRRARCRARCATLVPFVRPVRVEWLPHSVLFLLSFVYTSGTRSISKVRRLLTSPERRMWRRASIHAIQTRLYGAFAQIISARQLAVHGASIISSTWRDAPLVYFRGDIRRYSFSLFLPWHSTRISVEWVNGA